MRTRDGWISWIDSACPHHTHDVNGNPIALFRSGCADCWIETIADAIAQAVSERDDEEIARLNAEMDSYSVQNHKQHEALQECNEHIARLTEALAGAHAIRCTCDGRTRDPRCVELQALFTPPPPAPTDDAPDPLDGFRPGLQR